MNGIAKLLSTEGFIQVNKALIRQLGLHEAVIIGELCAEYNYWEEQGKLIDDMFYSSRENIEQNTGLNEHYQRKALKTLADKEIITVVKMGMPAVNHYKVNFDKLLNLLSTSHARDEAQVMHEMNLNNNKTSNKEQKNNSKELLQNEPTFTFGKQKQKKDNLYTKCVSLIDDYTTDDVLRKALIDYLQVRLEVKDKPLYTNSWKGLLNKLDREFDASERLAVVRQSIERGYLSFYPISSYNSGSIKSESGASHVPNMTQADYEEEEKQLAELEAMGVQVRF